MLSKHLLDKAFSIQLSFFYSSHIPFFIFYFSKEKNHKHIQRQIKLTISIFLELFNTYSLIQIPQSFKLLEGELMILAHLFFFIYCSMASLIYSNFASKYFNDFLSLLSPPIVLSKSLLSQGFVIIPV